jgi:hypothetical protein
LCTTLEVLHAYLLFPVCAPSYDQDTTPVCGIHVGIASSTLSDFPQAAEISIQAGNHQCPCDLSCAFLDEIASSLTPEFLIIH